MSLAQPLATSFYTGGSGTTDQVPNLYQAALDGVGFMLDETVDWGHASLPLLRDQADTSVQPSEQSLSPEGLWRRSMESWHRGAGQQIRDAADGDPYRFRNSKGVNPWTRWGLSLLPTTDEALASANTNLQLAVAGAYLYVVDGTAVRFTDDLSTWTAMTGLSGNTIVGLTSDGANVYVTDGTDIWRTAAGTTAAGSVWNTLDADLLGYVKGRLMAAHDNVLYNITSSAAPSALFTHPNADFRWVGFAPGNATSGGGFIYAAGYAGDKSLIYRTAIQPDGTALETPVVAGELPDGEVVRAIGGYLGYVLLGTDKGVAFCTVTGAGDLIVGERVGPEKAVRCFEGQDRFVWFGWDDYDSTSTGLGRLDLTQFITSSAPAYASDLMVTDQGDVLSVATFLSKRVLAVSGSGVWVQSDNLVPSGHLDSGDIVYGLSADDKVAMYVNIRHEPLAGEIAVSLSVDGAAFAALGTSEVASSIEPNSPLGANESKGTAFELRTTLTRSSSTTTSGPTLTRATLKAYPASLTGQRYLTPFLLTELVECVDGQDRKRDPEADLARLEQLQQSRRVVTFQLGSRRLSVIVEDVEFRPTHPTENRSWWNGTALCRLKRFSTN